MEILQDPEFKTMYQKYKVRVKLWESRFTKEHGRKPNKNDIKEADMKIKESYKMYWKLKTRALEETFIDITFDDETQDNGPNKNLMDISGEEGAGNKSLRDDDEHVAGTACKTDERNAEDVEQSYMENSDEKGIENISKEDMESIDKKDTENVDPQGYKNQPAIRNESVDENECKNVKGAWGDHLSKANEDIPKKRQSLFVGRTSSFQLSQNKFASANFIKRNPRKSLSMSKIKSKPERDDNTCTNTPEQTKTMETNNKDELDCNEAAKAIFGEVVKVTYAESKPTNHSLATVQDLIQGHTINRNLNTGWLDRCAKQNNLEYPALESQMLSGTSDSGIESVESSIHSPRENIIVPEPAVAPQISDEEDFVCNSDSEEERRNKRIRNLKKRFSDQDNQPSKKLCVTNDTNLSTACAVETQTTNDNVVSSDKKYDTNRHDNTAVVKNKEMSGSGDIDRNSAKNTGKCNEKIKDAPQVPDNIVHDENNPESPPQRKTVTHRKVRRRIKHVPSDDSDADFDETEERAKSNKKKAGKPKRASRTSKKKATNESAVKSVKGVGKTRKSSRKKKDTQINEDVETETVGAETVEDKEPTVYGIESLEAVPRFAVGKTKQGDLIQQFAKSVTSKNDNSSECNNVPTKPKGKLTDKEKLEKKVMDGKVNENFVRINIKKKVFVRGKKNFNFSKYKKNQWKQKKKDLGSSEGSLAVADFVEKNGGVSTCFKCGELGHFSRRCPNTKGDDLIPLNEIDETSQFPTLEEAQEMASQNAVIAHGSRIDRLPEKPSYTSKTDDQQPPNEPGDNVDNDDLWEPIEDEEILCGHKIPEDLVQKLLPPEIGAVQPLYEINGNESSIEPPSEVFETLRKFGHDTFRPGQEKAVMRILSGRSTLVTLSTGSGKSLCYQLPAYLYAKHSNCITLVISPLVSLMDDQVTGVPSFLSAACLHTNQTPKVRENVMQLVKQGKLNILLISPEAVVAGEKSTGFGALLRQLPPIAFACIDEAHCISQWSHNFRPSYLMVCRVLREKLGVKTVLALTATATKATAESIVNHLGINDGMAGVISDIPMPKNLLLSVSKDENRDEALIELLQSARFEECNSIIVYCTRREECVRIAGLLRACLQDINKVEKSKLSSIAEAYHAGLSAHRRKIVQKAFMGGQTRIVVATVAFGMGLNKPDIRAVVHYNMPGAFEGYVQEVGRAGRDGLPAHCHLFLNPAEDGDKLELRRHIYANGVDRHTIRRLLQKVFVPCSCAKLRGRHENRRCPGHEVAIPIDETVAALDISEETIATLLCYLELHPRRFITVLSSVYVRARVSSYAGPQALKQAAQSSPPLAMAIALDLQNGVSHDNDSVIEFPVVDVASAIGWDSGVVKSHLKSLEWKTVDGASKRSSISVRYDRLGLRVKSPGDLTDLELDEALDALVSRARSQETSSLQQLETIGVTLHKSSVATVRQCERVNDEIAEKSEQLKGVIRRYFDGEVLLDVDPKQEVEASYEAEVASDVRNLIVNYRDNNFTGRAIARIFHGIPSPNYPAYVWNKCRFWRAHLSCNFNALCQIATREILALR